MRLCRKKLGKWAICGQRGLTMVSIHRDSSMYVQVEDNQRQYNRYSSISTLGQAFFKKSRKEMRVLEIGHGGLSVEGKHSIGESYQLNLELPLATIPIIAICRHASESNSGFEIIHHGKTGFPLNYHSMLDSIALAQEATEVDPTSLQRLEDQRIDAKRVFSTYNSTILSVGESGELDLEFTDASSSAEFRFSRARNGKIQYSETSNKEGTVSVQNLCKALLYLNGIHHQFELKNFALLKDSFHDYASSVGLAV